LQIDDGQATQGVVGIRMPDRAVCGTPPRSYPEVTGRQVQQRTVHHIGERQRGAIERVSGRDAVDREHDSGAPAISRRTESSAAIDALRWSNESM